MRNTKKVVAILLTLLMVVGMMSTFAFAATGTGSITIDNPKSDETYTVYKVLDASTNGSTAYSYTIDKSSVWYNLVKNAADSDGNKYFTLTAIASDSTKESVAQTDKFDAVDFAKKLKEYAGSNDVNASKVGNLNSSNSYMLSNLSYGYYFVNTAVGSFANLNTVTSNVTISDKNHDHPFDKTVTKVDSKVVTGDDKVVSADIGDVIGYQLKTVIPSSKGYDVLNYTMKDKLTDGLTYNNDAKYVIETAEGTEMTVPSTAVTVNTPVSGEIFNITFDMTKLQDYVGKNIYVRYSATLNEKAKDLNENGATLNYNKPDGSIGEVPSKADVKTALIKINKYDADDNTNKLSGAKFVLKNSEGKYYQALDADDNKIENISADSAIKNVNWVDNRADASAVTTNADGEAYFKGVAPGTYSLEEIEAPNGYNLLTSDVSITVTAGDSNSHVTVGYTADVPNSTGSMLPSTGGIGTTIFYLIGAILVIGAGVVFVTRRRMHSEK